MATERPYVLNSTTKLLGPLPAASGLPAPPPITLTAATTLSSTHIGAWLNCNMASATNLTVATTTGVVGDMIYGHQMGAGIITFVAGASVTINVDPTFGRKTFGQYAPWFLRCTATNVWLLGGRLGAP